MRTNKTKQVKAKGAALILVVVVTVLLAVIGVMFMMVSRLSEMETVAIADSRDLDAGVQTVVNRIDEVLARDLFGNDNTIVNADSGNIDADESNDYPMHNHDLDPVTGFPFLNGPDGTPWTPDDIPIPGNLDDYWLASLEPVWSNNNGTPADPTDDIYVWPHITDLWGTIQGRADSLFTQSYLPSPVQWIDPDNINDPATWDEQAEWDLWQVSADNVEAKVIAYEDRMDTVAVIGGTMPTSWQNAANETDVRSFGARADADGDGVADSRWVRIPGLTTSRGQDVYAAIRITDNCGMLNLNAAHCFYQEDTYDPTSADRISSFESRWNYFVDNGTSWDITPYHNNQSGTGRYLTDINYYPFLRGRDLNGDSFFDSSETGDYWLNIMMAKNMTFMGTITGFGNGPIPVAARQNQSMFFHVDDPVYSGSFFDIADELELRNRYLLTSSVESRIEQITVANYTLDSGGGAYSALTVPRDYTNNFDAWTRRIEPNNFDEFNPAAVLYNNEYEYDRRHVCTVYSFDRIFRRGSYPQLDSEVEAYAQANFGPPFLTWNAYEAYLWQRWGPIFTPIGPVTTNIENPDAAQAYNNVETRRRILHLLYALRDYYMEPPQSLSKNAAAVKAAQIVANLIDFSDNNSANDDNTGDADGLVDVQGPFYEPIFPLPGGYNIDYGQQANAECTFINKNIVDQMVLEVSQYELGFGNEIDVSLPVYTSVGFDFGLSSTDVVFGYEQQPFISEIYVKWTENDSATELDDTMDAFAIEVVNPYSQTLDMEGWKIRIGSGATAREFTFDNDPTWDVPDIGSGRAVYHGSGAVTVPGGVLITSAITEIDDIKSLYYNTGSTVDIQLLRPAPANTGLPAGTFICVDSISDTDVRSILNQDGEHSLQRYDDANWKFIYNEFAPVQSVVGYTIGTPNTQTNTNDAFQLAVPDDQNPLSRWHDLEVLSMYGNEPESSDPNVVPEAITTKIADAATAGDVLYLNLETDASILDYLGTINRPDIGTLPGRININTAPVHVIAAAIPPSLADPNLADPNILLAGPSGYSSLSLAQDIIAGRPYHSLSELLNIPRFKEYDDTGAWAAKNVGMQSIEDDVEEEHWILSNLANKFTVRSDVFTAYILIRLGEDGPQRRMIAIFDRSGVWSPDDRPELVALHPVPDPR